MTVRPFQVTLAANPLKSVEMFSDANVEAALRKHVTLPVLASPKLDGIRAFHDGDVDALGTQVHGGAQAPDSRTYHDDPFAGHSSVLLTRH